LVSKRKSSNDETTPKDDGFQPVTSQDSTNLNPTHQHGARGAYTKQSLSTLNRKARHARKYASLIHSFFPVIDRAAKKPRLQASVPSDQMIVQHVIVDSDSESGDVERLATSLKVGKL
jgi:hypothetical protein